MTNRNKPFSEEFQQVAVNYYYSSGKSMKDTSSDLKISHSSINNWLQNAKSNDGIVDYGGSGNYSSDAENEIARLKKTIGILNKN